MIGQIAGAALAEPPEAPKDDPEAAHRQLNLILDRMAGFVVARPEAGEIVQFVLRELSQPSEALDIIYEGVFEPSTAGFAPSGPGPAARMPTATAPASPSSP